MAFINQQMSLLKGEMQTFVTDIDKRWLEMIADKNAMAAETHRFLKNMEKQNQEFVKSTKEELDAKGFQV